MMVKSLIPAEHLTIPGMDRTDCAPDIFVQKNGEIQTLPEAMQIKMENQNIFGDQNQILLRYAEVLLTRAECKIRTGDVAGGYG